jgi:hypothetical protein
MLKKLKISKLISIFFRILRKKEQERGRGGRAKSEERRAKGKGQRAKGKGQRAKGKGQRANSKELRVTGDKSREIINRR